jgi:hypothetical protein
MGFKMKGMKFYGEQAAKDGHNNYRAKSSPLQVNDGKKTKEQLLKEGFTPADADKMMKDGATTGETSKPSLISQLSAKEKAIYNALSPKEKANINKNTTLSQLRQGLVSDKERDANQKERIKQTK